MGTDKCLQKYLKFTYQLHSIQFKKICPFSQQEVVIDHLSLCVFSFATHCFYHVYGFFIVIASFSCKHSSYSTTSFCSSAYRALLVFISSTVISICIIVKIFTKNSIFVTGPSRKTYLSLSLLHVTS